MVIKEAAMLSYMVPVDEKPPPAPAPVVGVGVGPGKGRLALELAGQPGSPETAARRALKTAISKDSSTSSFASDLTLSSSTPTGAAHDKPKHKLLTNGTKHTSLKRVSFGSSKGSMVETLIYESPLQEEPESSPPPKLQETAFPYTPVEDDSERAKVRVSFYQGARPQCLSPPPAPPDSHTLYAALLAATHPDMADHAAYNRQISTESGWDNPFRPDGDLSREADEIVSLIKGGKPITPTPTAQPQLPICEEEEKQHANNLSAKAPSSPQTKVSRPVQASTPKAMNGTKNGGGEARGPGAVEVSRSPPPEPQQPEHVTIKKKPKCKCCVLQ